MLDIPTGATLPLGIDRSLNGSYPSCNPPPLLALPIPPPPPQPPSQPPDSVTLGRRWKHSQATSSHLRGGLSDTCRASRVAQENQGSIRVALSTLSCIFRPRLGQVAAPGSTRCERGSPLPLLTLRPVRIPTSTAVLLTRAARAAVSSGASLGNTNTGVRCTGLRVWFRADKTTFVKETPDLTNYTPSLPSSLPRSIPSSLPSLHLCPPLYTSATTATNTTTTTTTTNTTTTTTTTTSSSSSSSSSSSFNLLIQPRSEYFLTLFSTTVTVREP
ncbi:hypothetical protein E2C01_011589 [Portunus trituberculatus]|uniref:Uncharacterized protein n=1 Tax=Portunus trituberculatus TaxID=210409 RepID=A0A5B7DBQ2_PORTR|nr:hypothetical protein [Portunus trituberculatus]